MRRVTLYYANCTITGYINSKGQFADMDGVLLTITEEPSMYEMDGEELPDIEFVEKNKKIISSSKEDLLNEMNGGTIINSRVENLSELEQKPVENLVQEEVDEMIDVPLDEETAYYLLGLLGNKEKEVEEED